MKMMNFKNRAINQTSIIQFLDYFEQLYLQYDRKIKVSISVALIVESCEMNCKMKCALLHKNDFRSPRFFGSFVELDRPRLHSLLL